MRYVDEPWAAALTTPLEGGRVQSYEQIVRVAGVQKFPGADGKVRSAPGNECNAHLMPWPEGSLNASVREFYGFFEDGTFLKLREVTASYNLPQRFASRLRSRSAAFVLTGRNLKTWTKYSGVDPENDYTVTGGGDAPADFQTVGPATYWIARLTSVGVRSTCA